MRSSSTWATSTGSPCHDRDLRSERVRLSRFHRAAAWFLLYVLPYTTTWGVAPPPVVFADSHDRDSGHHDDGRHADDHGDNDRHAGDRGHGDGQHWDHDFRDDDHDG